MLKFLTTEILVFLVLHWIDWRAHGNNCDYYYVGQDEKISITPLSHSAVAIDMPDPSYWYPIAHLTACGHRVVVTPIS